MTTIAASSTAAAMASALLGLFLCYNTRSAAAQSGNGNVFGEYIGALYNGVKLSDIPLTDGNDVEAHIILAFAIDYTSDGSAVPTNGEFASFWDTSAITPDAVQAFKSSNPNTKLFLSLGGDTINNNYAQFQPTSVDSWLSNALSSLTSLIQTYHLDGIDIDYEHFDNATSADFVSAIGQLITRLKQNEVISVASIAPFDDGDKVRDYYAALWAEYASVIDFVNFQFYTHDATTTVSQYVSYYDSAVQSYPGGKVLTSFTTAEDANSVSPSAALSASQELQASHRLPGIFIWCADDSFASSVGFQYEREAQSILANATAV